MAENLTKIQFKGGTYTVARPTQAQAIALAMAEASGGDWTTQVRVLAKILSHCLGAKQWGFFMDGMSDGTYNGQDFMDLVQTLVKTMKDDTPDGV